MERFNRRIMKKLLWLLSMAVLCFFLMLVVSIRKDNLTMVIFGGTSGAYVSSDSSSLASLTVVETPEPTPDIWPKIDIELTQYTIVNDSHLVSSMYAPEEATLIEGTSNMMFDSTAVVFLNQMLADCRAAGHTVVVAAAYRSYSYQNKLFNSKASQIAYAYGVTDYNDPIYQEAAKEARKITMYPGSSEHQLGLAVDLMDRMYSTLNYSKMDQELFAWLDAHCAEYGFIKRYPTKKLLLTGWDEPYHYRYVGIEAATFIMENDLCYEEFYAHYDSGFTY